MRAARGCVAMVAERCRPRLRWDDRAGDRSQTRAGRSRIVALLVDFGFEGLI